jgi:hypothetical protein
MVHSTGIGKRRMIRSMKTLGTALPMNRLLVDPHVPGTIGFQFFSTGSHIKIVPKMIPIHQATLRAWAIQMVILNQVELAYPGNTRRRRNKAEAFVKSRAVS